MMLSSAIITKILSEVLQLGASFLCLISINSNPSCPIRLRDSGRREYVCRVKNVPYLLMNIASTEERMTKPKYAMRKNLK